MKKENPAQCINLNKNVTSWIRIQEANGMRLHVDLDSKHCILKHPATWQQSGSISKAVAPAGGSGCNWLSPPGIGSARRPRGSDGSTSSH
jgi:hypothetical protein